MRGAIYEGQFSQGVKEGWGRLILANATYYVGYFKNDMPDGLGQMAICYVSMDKLAKYERNFIKIKELDLEEDYEIKEGEFQMGSLVSS